MIPDLTQRERELLALLCSGTIKHREIASRMHIADRTAKYHLDNLKMKLGVSSKAEVIVFAYSCGMWEVDQDANTANKT